MRAVIVAGMMVAAGAACAGDFGVDYQTAKKSLTDVIRPPLVEEGCVNDVCSFRSAEHEIGVRLVLGNDKVVELFGIDFRPNNWAVAAAYGRSIQRELLVPERDIAQLDNLARHAVTGVVNDERTNSVTCEAKQIDQIPIISCFRR